MSQMPPPPMNPGSNLGPADHKLVQSILVTLCCCLPFGIAAIIFSAMAMSANNEQNYAKAHECSEKAGKFILWGFITGIVINIVVVIIQVLAAAAAASV